MTEGSFSGANLTGANFTDTNLTEVNLIGANLTNVNLNGAIFCNTFMPDGTIEPKQVRLPITLTWPVRRTM